MRQVVLIVYPSTLVVAATVDRGIASVVGSGDRRTLQLPVVARRLELRAAGHLAILVIPPQLDASTLEATFGRPAACVPSDGIPNDARFYLDGAPTSPLRRPGEYRFGNLIPGEHRLTMFASGYLRYEWPPFRIATEPDRDVVLSPAEPRRPELIFVAPRDVNITVYVGDTVLRASGPRRYEIEAAGFHRYIARRNGSAVVEGSSFINDESQTITLSADQFRPPRYRMNIRGPCREAHVWVDDVRVGMATLGLDGAVFSLPPQVRPGRNHSIAVTCVGMRRVSTTQNFPETDYALDIALERERNLPLHVMTSLPAVEVQASGVTVLSGRAANGRMVPGEVLRSAECAGSYAPAAQHMLRVESGDNPAEVHVAVTSVYQLRVLVLAPDGEFHCNAMSPGTRSLSVSIPRERGEYRVWVASDEEPRRLDEPYVLRASLAPIPAHTLEDVTPDVRVLDASSTEPIEGTVPEGMEPHWLAGELDRDCVGWGDSRPSFRVRLGAARRLVLEVTPTDETENADPVVLARRVAAGARRCADDTEENRGARLALDGETGDLWDVWVGSFVPGQRYHYEARIRRE